MEPDYKWIAQDECGVIWRYHTNKPVADVGVWFNGIYYGSALRGRVNPNWRYSLIDLEKEDYEIVDGILTRKLKAKKELTDTELLDAIEKHSLIVDRNVESKNAITVWNKDDFTGATSKKGDIRKAIKKWLKKNVDKKELTE